jgi:hypothetical protein
MPRIVSMAAIIGVSIGDVDASVSANGIIDQLLDRRFVRHVDHTGGGAVADLRRELLERFGKHISEHEEGTLLGEQPCGRCTDTVEPRL